MGRAASNMTDEAMGKLVNDELEQFLIGNILAYPECLERISWFDAAFFGFDLHARIFNAMKTLRSQGREFGPNMIAQFFEGAEDAPEPGYVSSLIQCATTPLAVKDIAHALLTLHYRRMALSVADSMRQLSINADIDAPPETLLDGIEKIIIQARGLKTADSSVSAAESAKQALALARNPKRGISSGFPGIDKMTGGFQGAALYVLAGRPGMGKTAMGLTLAVNASLAGSRVLFFSLEMSHAQLMQRVLSRFSGSAVHSGDVPYDTDTAMEKASGLALDIDDASGLTALDIASRAAQHKRRKGLDMVIVDYLGLVQPSDKKANKVHQIEEVTQAMKRLSKDLGIPVILLSQLSRALEGRDDKRPGLGDLRDSGAIEQDADCVMFIYREEYYEKKEKKSKIKSKNSEVYDMADQEAAKNKAELIVAKNRQGCLGTVDLKFSGEAQTFSE